MKMAVDVGIFFFLNFFSSYLFYSFINAIDISIQSSDFKFTATFIIFQSYPPYISLTPPAFLLHSFFLFRLLKQRRGLKSFINLLLTSFRGILPLLEPLFFRNYIYIFFYKKQLQIQEFQVFLSLLNSGSFRCRFWAK